MAYPTRLLVLAWLLAAGPAQAVPMTYQFNLFDGGGTNAGSGSFTVDDIDPMEFETFLLLSLGEFTLVDFTVSFVVPPVSFDESAINDFLLFTDATGRVSNWAADLATATPDASAFIADLPNFALEGWSVDFINANGEFESAEAVGPGTVRTVPEPLTLGLMGLGFAAIGASRRIKNRGQIQTLRPSSV